MGDQIHYTVMYRRDGAPKFVEDYILEPEDPTVIRVVDSVWLEAVSSGRSEVLVRSDVGELAFSIDVEPDARPPIPATHHTEVDRIAGVALLFVGHANLDGWDHTAVAKPGIDRLVREFKARGHPVVYFVSQDYPFWYTEDRQPDLAVVSEGQEHQIVVDAERVVFSGAISSSVPSKRPDDAARHAQSWRSRTRQFRISGRRDLDWVWGSSGISSPHDTPRSPHVGAVLCAGAIRAIGGSVF